MHEDQQLTQRRTRPSKYQPLTDRLATTPGPQFTLTWTAIEAGLGVALPPSACDPKWWHNRPYGHSHARAWLRAGWRVAHVDTALGVVTFVR